MAKKKERDNRDRDQRDSKTVKEDKKDKKSKEGKEKKNGKEGPATLTGIQKAAILIITIGTKSAARMLKTLNEKEVEKITMEIAKIRNVKPAMAESVLREFYQTMEAKKYILEGGYEYAEKLLNRLGGGIDSQKVLNKLREQSGTTSVFDEFQAGKINQIAGFIQNEHPQVAALIFSQLNIDKSSEILSHLDEKLQAEIVYRLASMDKITSEVIEEIEEVIKEQMGGVSALGDRVKSGTKTVAQILNEADITVERNVLDDIQERNPQMAAEIKNQMFLFEDIIHFDDRTVQLIINELEQADLMLGLKGVDEELSDKFLSNMSTRAAEMLEEDMEALGPVPLKDVKEAQQRIIRSIKQLEADGQITTRKLDEEEVVE